MFLLAFWVGVACPVDLGMYGLGGVIGRVCMVSVMEWIAWLGLLLPVCSWASFSVGVYGGGFMLCVAVVSQAVCCFSVWLSTACSIHPFISALGF